MNSPQKLDPITQYFVDMEKKWLLNWEKNDVVKRYREKNKDSEKRFSFQDGPITANNPMGVHHAWGRTYKDLWQRFYNLLGYRQRFQSGFDCQGLWVEVEVEKELGLRTKKDIENLVKGDRVKSVAKFVDLCKDRVYKYSKIQTDQSKRLGYFMDWDHSYFTMSDENNYMIWHFLKVCHENGWIYKGHESVPWCPRCETAISQHEMLTEDYKEVVHESIYFELPLVGRDKEFLLVWTTTPWTLPANIAVAVDRDLEYACVQGETGDKYWIAKSAISKIFGKDAKSIQILKGSDLEGLKYEGPFDDLEVVQKVARDNPKTFHSVILTDPKIMPITTEEGTGMVHTAVSAGTEDFKLGKKLGLPMIPVIEDDATYMSHMGYLAGKNAKKNPGIIFDVLKEKESRGDNWIFSIEKYKHRYPGCWRCKAELVWKVADEWYIAMDKPSKGEDTRTLREKMIANAKKIKWIPEFGLDRELDWLTNMHDWLISKKNRYWGLALPIYECQDCKTFQVIGSKKELQEKSSEGWGAFEGRSPHKPYIDEVKISCPTCKKSLERVGDVGNPWLDAGIVPFSTIAHENEGTPLYLSDKTEWQRWFPVDFITESFPGQFKNWFYAMIAMASALEDTNPFKQVLGFATLVGEDGRPMHKSWGNSIEFNQGADEIGVDVMRWMYARQNPAENLAFGPTKAKEVRRQFYLTLWNIYKFYRTNAEIDAISYPSEGTLIPTNVLDEWILSRLTQVVEAVRSSLIAYDPRSAAEEIESFVQDMSLWYIRRSRDRVGASVSDKSDKHEFYSTSQKVLITLSLVISPFLPFISEEMYTTLTGEESVHLAKWPELKNEINTELLHDMALVREIAELGHRLRKEHLMKVRQPLASLDVSLPKNTSFSDESKTLEYANLLALELNVRNVRFLPAEAEELTLEFDFDLTPELILEGEMRELVRSIQVMRKKQGFSIGDTINLTVDEKFKPFEAQIAQSVQAKKITYGADLFIEKV